MKIPSKIKVGAYTYEVQYKKLIKDRGIEHWGTCNREKHIIELLENMPADRKAEILLHECLHAIEESYDILLGERKINLLALALVALIKDNNLRII